MLLVLYPLFSSHLDTLCSSFLTQLSTVSKNCYYDLRQSISWFKIYLRFLKSSMNTFLPLYYNWNLNFHWAQHVDCNPFRQRQFILQTKNFRMVASIQVLHHLCTKPCSFWISPLPAARPLTHFIAVIIMLLSILLFTGDFKTKVIFLHPEPCCIIWKYFSTHEIDRVSTLISKFLGLSWETKVFISF